MFNMKLRLNLTAVVCLLLVVVSAARAQTPKPKHPNAVALRSKFVTAFRKDFDLVKDEFKTRTNDSSGELYWLAHAKPKRSGYFRLQYRYRYNDKLYSHVEREVGFSVGPKGCRRGQPYAGTYSRFCLGDTVILPVVIDRYTEHEFKLVKFEPLTDEKDWETFDDKYPESRDQGLDKTQVANPAAESLRYVGSRSHKMLHRSLGYTLELHADFEAVGPGRFNLLVSSSPQDVRPGAMAVGSTPIIVVGRYTPVTLIAGHEEVRGFAMGYDGREYESSTSGNGYMTNVVIMQPGDRISLRYFSTVRGREFERGPDTLDPSENLKPVISVHPFSIEPAYDFTDWIAAFLPK